MIKLFLHLFLWWWPVLPAPVRYGISAAVAGIAVVLWIFVPEAWAVWLLMILIGTAMSLYGEPSDSEKGGYNF